MKGSAYCRLGWHQLTIAWESDSDLTLVFFAFFPQLPTGMSIYQNAIHWAIQTPWTTISPQPSRNLNYQGENTSCWIRIKENIHSPNLLDVKLGKIITPIWRLRIFFQMAGKKTTNNYFNMGSPKKMTGVSKFGLFHLRTSSHGVKFPPHFQVNLWGPTEDPLDSGLVCLWGWQKWQSSFFYLKPVLLFLF